MDSLGTKRYEKIICFKINLVRYFKIFFKNYIVELKLMIFIILNNESKILNVLM
jgi:hypothetical protein